MKITSMDITNKEFKKAIRGYDIDDVDEFLDKISEDYELLYKENSTMKEKIAALSDQIEHYNKMETTIQKTLVLAQNAADQAKQSAQKEADLILKNANETAQKILDKAHNDVIQITDQYDNVKQEFIKFRTKFRNFMNSQIDMFDSMEKDFVKNYNVGTELKELKAKDIDEVEAEPEPQEDFKVSTIKEEFFNEDTNINEIKNFFVKK